MSTYIFYMCICILPNYIHISTMHVCIYIYICMYVYDMYIYIYCYHFFPNIGSGLIGCGGGGRIWWHQANHDSVYIWVCLERPSQAQSCSVEQLGSVDSVHRLTSHRRPLFVSLFIDGFWRCCCSSWKAGCRMGEKTCAKNLNATCGSPTPGQLLSEGRTTGS